MRPKFAEILSSRREQLRLTIPQAAQVLRMRESVLEAFEAGDFDHLPPLGYAQGMVSSYARYLGLDPAMVYDLYEREHSDYVLQVTGSRPTGLASMADEPNVHDPASSVRRSDVDPRAQTYMDPVATSRARVGQDPYPKSSPQNTSRTHAMRPTNLPQRYNSSPGYGVEGSYSASQSAQSAQYASDRRYSSQLAYGDTGHATFEEGYEQSSSSRGSSRRYTSRAPEQVNERTRRNQAGRVRRSRSSDDAYSEEYGVAGRSSRDSYASRVDNARYTDDIQMRRVSTSQYTDDLRYDSETSSYRASSTREGRAGVHNMQRPERIENVRRRQNPQSARNRGRSSQPQTFSDYVQVFFSDPRRAILSIGVLLSRVLLLILVFCVRSCVEANTGTGKQVSVVTTLAASSEAATTTSELEQQVVSEAAAQKAASAEAAAYTETVVKVSVESGATTWVEITCDGEQKVAESITGEWSQEYTVTQSITIQVVDPSSVTVEKNGEVQAFSSKSAGLSSMTIEGTDPAAAAAATAETSDASDESSDDGSDDSSDGSSE